MFGKNAKKENYFISRMTDYMNDAMSKSDYHPACAKEIRTMLKDFFKKSMATNIDWTNSSITCWLIIKITKAVQNIVRSTCDTEKMLEEDVRIFQKIFEECDRLYAEVLEHDSQSCYNNKLINKISCINEIACKNYASMRYSEKKYKNWRNGLIFQDYESLWRIIHRVNTEWDDLCSRGFSIKVFLDFCEYSKCEVMSENEKISTLMRLLDGKMKMIPTYGQEYRLLGFMPVDIGYNDATVISDYTRKHNSYCMKQVGE